MFLSGYKCAINKFYNEDFVNVCPEAQRSSCIVPTVCVMVLEGIGTKTFLNTTSPEEKEISAQRVKCPVTSSTVGIGNDVGEFQLRRKDSLLSHNHGQN